MARFWPRRGDSSRNRVWKMHPVFRVADHAHCTRVVRRYELPCVVWLPFFIPALSRLPGHNPAQLANIKQIKMADCNSDAIEAISTLNAKIDSLQYQLANPSPVADARSYFTIAKYQTIIDAFHYQAIEGSSRCPRLVNM